MFPFGNFGPGGFGFGGYPPSFMRADDDYEEAPPPRRSAPRRAPSPRFFYDSQGNLVMLNPEEAQRVLQSRRGQHQRTRTPPAQRPQYAGRASQAQKARSSAHSPTHVCGPHYTCQPHYAPQQATHADPSMQALLRRLEEIQRGRGVQQPAPQARPGLDPREMLYQQQQRPAYARPVEEDSPYDDEEYYDDEGSGYDNDWPETEPYPPPTRGKFGRGQPQQPTSTLPAGLAEAFAPYLRQQAQPVAAPRQAQFAPAQGRETARARGGVVEEPAGLRPLRVSARVPQPASRPAAPQLPQPPSAETELLRFPLRFLVPDQQQTQQQHAPNLPRRAEHPDTTQTNQPQRPQTPPAAPANSKKASASPRATAAAAAAAAAAATASAKGANQPKHSLTKSQAARIIQSSYRGWRIRSQSDTIRTLMKERKNIQHAWDRYHELYKETEGNITHKNVLEVQELAMRPLLALDACASSTPEVRAVRKRLTNSALELQDKVAEVYQASSQNIVNKPPTPTDTPTDATPSQTQVSVPPAVQPASTLPPELARLASRTLSLPAPPAPAAAADAAAASEPPQAADAEVSTVAAGVAAAAAPAETAAASCEPAAAATVATEELPAAVSTLVPSYVEPAVISTASTPPTPTSTPTPTSDTQQQPDQQSARSATPAATKALSHPVLDAPPALLADTNAARVGDETDATGSHETGIGESEIVLAGAAPEPGPVAVGPEGALSAGIADTESAVAAEPGPVELGAVDTEGAATAATGPDGASAGIGGSESVSAHEADEGMSQHQDDWSVLDNMSSTSTRSQHTHGSSAGSVDGSSAAAAAASAGRPAARRGVRVGGMRTAETRMLRQLLQIAKENGLLHGSTGRAHGKGHKHEA